MSANDNVNQADVRLLDETYTYISLVVSGDNYVCDSKLRMVYQLIPRQVREIIIISSIALNIRLRLTLWVCEQI